MPFQNSNVSDEHFGNFEWQATQGKRTRRFIVYKYTSTYRCKTALLAVERQLMKLINLSKRTVEQKRTLPVGQAVIKN